MTTWTDIRHGTITGAEQRFWKALGKDAERVAISMILDQDYLDRLVELAKANVNSKLKEKPPAVSSKSTTSLNSQWLRARKIMGRNFFGVEEAVKYFGVNPTKAQLAALAEIPWSGAQLSGFSQTHILVAVFPLSILKIREKLIHRSLLNSLNDYNSQLFASSNGRICWQLIQRTAAVNSFGRLPHHQTSLLCYDEEVPTSQVMTYAIIGHFLTTDEHLFKETEIRCSDVDGRGHAILLGYFGDSGLRIEGDDYGGRTSTSLGLAAAKKLPDIRNSLRPVRTLEDINETGI